MHDQHFDILTRALSRGTSRRGALAAVAGVAALHLTETESRRRKRNKRDKRVKREAKKGGNGSTPVAPQKVTIKEGCPANPPESIAILHAYYPGYWWDHTNLTVAVQAHPNAEPALTTAVGEAIAIWDRILRRETNGIVTLTDVTPNGDPEHKADITLHYVPHAGGTVFAGYAICGQHKCNNVLVSSDAPKPLGIDQYSPLFLGQVTLHELGHALGLGHAEPLEETNDLMGYGWPPLEPVLSPCDLRALKVVFAWALTTPQQEPAPPTVASVSCSGLCKVR